MNNNLNFTSHMSELRTKASQKVGAPVRLRNLSLCYAKLSLYKSSILPHLTYWHLVWHFVDHEICPEMHALAKMAEMAINRQNRQTVNKNSNEVAKGPFGKWRFRRKWRIW